MLSRVASWHHGSSVSVILTPIRRRRSSSPRSVILGKRDGFSLGMRRLPTGRWRAGLGRTEGLAVDLARWRFRQLRHERDVARVLVPAQARAREILELARK